MRKLLAILAVALAIPTMSFADDKGRYQGVLVNDDQRTRIWVVDTKTGLVKLCFATLPTGFQLRSKCTAWNSEIEYYADENLNPIED